MKDMQIICLICTTIQLMVEGRHALAEGSLAVEIHSPVCCRSLNL